MKLTKTSSHHKIMKSLETTKVSHETNNASSSVDNTKKPLSKPRQKKTSSLTKPIISNNGDGDFMLHDDGSQSEQTQFKAKFVHVVTKGIKPRRTARVLLNSKSAKSFEKVLDCFTETLKPNWGVVRKLYSFPYGKEVSTLRDLFNHTEIVLAMPNDKICDEDMILSVDEWKRVGCPDFCTVEQHKPLPVKNRKTISSQAVQQQKEKDEEVVNSKILTKAKEVLNKKRLMKEKSQSKVIKELGASTSTSSFKQEGVTKKNAYDDESDDDTIIPDFDFVGNRINGRGDESDNERPNSRVDLECRVPFEFLSKYTISHIINVGSFSKVVECVSKLNLQKYALKITNKEISMKHLCNPAEEYNMLKSLSHPNIVCVYDSFDLAFCPDFYMVMEYVSRQDLYELIKQRRTLSEQEAAWIIKDIASALCYIHSRCIVHQDVKPENCVVFTDEDNRQRVKLSDFGLAMTMTEPVNKEVSSNPSYRAPEILRCVRYDYKVDVYSLGWIIYLLLCGYPPFHSFTGDVEELRSLIIIGEYDFLDEDWKKVSGDAKDLIKNCLVKDPEVRLNSEDLLKHNWLLKNANEADSSRDFDYNMFDRMKVLTLPTIHLPTNM